DRFSLTPLAGESLVFTHDGIEVVDITDDDGIARASFAAGPGDNVAVTTTYSGTGLYNSSADTDELFVLRERPRGDIVFMIDESSSMGAHQAAVKASVTNIANQLGAAIDFQLG